MQQRPSFSQKRQQQQRGSILQQFTAQAYRKDGVDHVHVHPTANSFVGRVASDDWRKTFFVPHIGEFSSPHCFAKWLGTGDEDARHNTRYRASNTIHGYYTYVLYAKYYQLCSLRSKLMRDYSEEMKKLPFAGYHVHTTGLKEFTRWREYPNAVKIMIDHLTNPELGTKKPFPWDVHFPELNVTEAVQSQLAALIEQYGTPVEDRQQENEVDEVTQPEQLDSDLTEEFNEEKVSQETEAEVTTV